MHTLKRLRSGPWSPEEEAVLFEKRSQGVPYRVIGDALGRSVKSCECHYRETNWSEKGYHKEYDADFEVKKEVAVTKLHNTYNTKLDNMRLRADVIADRLVEAIPPLPKAPPIYVPGSHRGKATPEDMGLMLSDLHIGHRHSLEETGGLSEYNVDIFLQRVENLKKAVVEIAELHSKLYKIPKLHIFSLGDIVDGMNAAGKWSAAYIDMPVVDQMMVGVRAISDMIYYWLGMFEEIHFYGIGGNHGRCLSKGTRILTPYGYKTYDQISEGDLVGTINPSTCGFEFQPVKKVHIFPNEKKMVRFSNRSFEMTLTKDHDVLYQGRYKNRLKKQKAEWFAKNTNWDNYRIPIAAASSNSEYDISDDMLSLLGWIMTDGGYDDRCSSITIYQSKPENVDIIESLLNRMGVIYNRKDRDRGLPNDICGVAVMSAKVSTEFYIKSSELTRKIRDILPIKESIPEWMYDLSDRQVMVLLSAIVAGDGTVRAEKWRDDGSYSPGGWDAIWGKKTFLESLSGLLVSHGIPCRINRQKRRVDKFLSNGEKQASSYYLQIKKSDHYCIKSKNRVEEIEYNDLAWCVTVENGTIAVMSESGNCFFTGNSAEKGVEKEYVNWDYVAYQMIELYFKNNPQVKIKAPKTWWMCEEIRNHKFLMMHGEDIKGGNFPIQGLLKVEQKLIGLLGKVPNYTLAGHFHNAAELTTNHGRVLINGSMIGSDVHSLKSIQAGSKAEQKLFGIHDDRGITWTYNIDLEAERE